MDAGPITRAIYANPHKRPRHLDSNSSEASDTDTRTHKKQHLPSEAERIADGLSALEVRNRLHATMLCRYSKRETPRQKGYQAEPPENSISTFFTNGVKALGFDENGIPRRAPDKEDIESAIENFKSAADVTEGCIEPEIPLLSARNLILIYEKNELKESPERQRVGLSEILRKGLEVAAQLTESHELSGIDTNSRPLKPKEDIARIYRHAMEHWDLFSEEEKIPLRARILQQMESNETFLDITYGAFRATVFADIFLDNTDGQSRKDFVEALEKRVNEDRNYKPPSGYFFRPCGASNLLRDVRAEQWKKEPTQENLERILADIEALMKEPRNWNKDSAVIRFFDLFIHADPNAKKQIAAKVADTMKMVPQLDSDSYSGELPARISCSRVALGTMILHHVAEGDSLDKDDVQKLLYWLTDSCGYISSGNLDWNHGAGKNSARVPRHSDEDRLVLLKCACEAASLIIEFSRDENVDKLTPDVFEKIEKMLARSMNEVRFIANRDVPKSEDERFVEMNRYLKQQIKDMSSGISFESLNRGISISV